MSQRTGLMILEQGFENSFEKSCFRIRLQETLCHNSLRASGRTAFVNATQKELLGQQLFSKLSKSYDRGFLEA